MTNDILTKLSAPFHPSRITWKPGALTGKKDKALALAYADLRAYQSRLDEVCGMNWSLSYTPWGDRIICHLTINGVTRSATGEADSQSERSGIAGTAAEAQAAKRACAMFGLGRYLYHLPSLWVEYDAANQRFTEKAKGRLQGMIAQHYQRWLDGQGGDIDAGDEGSADDRSDDSGPSGGAEAVSRETTSAGSASDAAKLEELGKELYGEQWAHVKAHNIKRLTGEETAPLTSEQIATLMNGLKKLKQQRQTA